jgi:hypothetical protein
MYQLPAKTTLTLAALSVFLTVPSVVPWLANYKTVDWTQAQHVFDFVPRRISPDPVAAESARNRPSMVPSNATGRLLDPQHNLDSFYRALRRVELREPGAVVRILHYGDSPTTADLITADARATLQRAFGDAGHGFYLIAKPWAWYGHRGIDSEAEGWKIDAANQSEIRDGLYGLGGVSFRGTEGTWAKFKLRGAGHTQVEISFLRQPGGGEFAIFGDGELLGTVITADREVSSGFAAFPLKPQTARLEIRVTSGHVRLFGIDLSKPSPGLVYSSLGLNGAYVSVPARLFKEHHWEEQLEHYRPDLVILNYGTNESVYASFVDQSMVKEMKELVRRVRSAVPGTSILIMSPMDRGERSAGGEIVTVSVMPRLVGLQALAAADLGCGFFNTFQAMGGVGTMAKWYQAEPRLVGGDFIHPMPAGARIVGDLLETALLDGYNRYKLRRVQLAENHPPEPAR